MDSTKFEPAARFDENHPYRGGVCRRALRRVPLFMAGRRDTDLDDAW